MAKSVRERLKKLAEGCERRCEHVGWVGPRTGKPNYRLLYSHTSTYRPGAGTGLMFLGTNPGGSLSVADVDDPWRPFGKERNYCAYLDDTWWQHPIQQTVLDLATELTNETNLSGEALLRQTPCGNLNPFRSERYGSLHRDLKPEGLRIGFEIIEIARPRVLILLSSNKLIWNKLMAELAHRPKPDWCKNLRPGKDGGPGARYYFREAVIRGMSPRPEFVWALPGMNKSTADREPISLLLKRMRRRRVQVADDGIRVRRRRSRRK